jgi:hypothetical protein
VINNSEALDLSTSSAAGAEAAMPKLENPTTPTRKQQTRLSSRVGRATIFIQDMRVVIFQFVE